MFPKKCKARAPSGEAPSLAKPTWGEYNSRKKERGMDMQRRDKVNYYLDLAEAVSQRGTCLRKLYGAVIVKNDEVISTGYVGAPRGRQNWGTACAASWASPGGSAMSCAVPSTRRPTPSSAPPAGT
mgnify:CR=1 FL=1